MNMMYDAAAGVSLVYHWCIAGVSGSSPTKGPLRIPLHYSMHTECFTTTVTAQ